MLLGSACSAHAQDMYPLTTAHTYHEYVVYHFQQSAPETDSHQPKHASEYAYYPSARLTAEFDELPYTEHLAFVARKLIVISSDRSKTAVFQIDQRLRFVMVEIDEGSEPRRGLLGLCADITPTDKPVTVSVALSSRIDRPVDRTEPYLFLELHLSY